MMKKFVVLLASLGLVLQLTSCTSNSSQSDSEVASDMESADLEKLEGDEALEVAGDDSLVSDQLPEDALGETTPSTDVAETTTETTTTTTVAENSPSDQVATTEQTDVATTTETMPADPFADQSAADVPPPPPVESSTTIADSSTSTDTTSMVESTTSTQTSSTTYVDESEAPKKSSAPLQKVASTPWKVGKTWFNTVYFARPGDSLSSISQMIYGADKTKELKKGNPTFASRDVRPGDKVYYNSPHRSDDASRVLTYYEDNGMAPQIYVAKAGDNIRKVSKEILGYDNAWKEVWSSNSVDSKGNIAEGTELRYWTSGAVAAAPAVNQEVAGSVPPPMETAPSFPPPGQDMNMPPQQAQGEIPPPPMPEQPMDMPPPPPPQDFAQNDQQMAPPPPPPPVEAINPPAPPVAQVEEAEATGMDNDTTMALAVVGLAAAGLAALIVIRKKRKQKELEQQGVDHTHVV